MKFLENYGFKHDPFGPDALREGGIFRSRDLLQCTNMLNFISEGPKILAVTGSAGIGKSVAVHHFKQQLNPSAYMVCYITLTTVTLRNFYKVIASEMGLDYGGNVMRLAKDIRTQALYQYQELRQPIVLIIDHAEYLSNQILRDLKLLSQYEFDSSSYFSMVFCGEPYFLSTLRKQANEGLAQRVWTHYPFGGLSDEEIPQYVRHKISAAGGHPAVVTDSALDSLGKMCGGCPRKIDKLMRDAFIFAAQCGRESIDAELMKKAGGMQLF